MGCLMNLLWLLLGGIFTAVEYLISSLLMMLHSFWNANIEVGRTCFMAFR
jgi:uncharacterized membrane protein YccF (DUF307 family)